MMGTRKRLSILALVSTTSLIAACAASGEKFSSVSPSFPPIAQNKARIFFYRTYFSWGAGMRPRISACGNSAGKSIPGGFSFIDVPAGDCEITIPSQMYPGERNLVVKLSPGETQYVKSWIGASGMAGRTNMEVVPEERALKEIRELAFGGEVYSKHGSP